MKKSLIVKYYWAVRDMLQILFLNAMVLLYAKIGISIMHITLRTKLGV
jgi:hypothetical protein